jgi:hypothetical protein
MVARGTVVGWAPQPDTGSARMRWRVTDGSVLPGRLAVKAIQAPRAHRSNEKEVPDTIWELSA